MKIYQIHEHSGEFDYYFDRIVGSYLHRSKAWCEVMKLRAREKERQKKCDKCSKCPILDAGVLSETFDVAQKKIQEYCSEADITEDVYGFDCSNYNSNWDEITYKIDEIEVIE